MEPLLDTRIYTLAFKFAMSNFKIIKQLETIDHYQDYYMTKNPENPITASYISIYKSKVWPLW